MDDWNIGDPEAMDVYTLRELNRLAYRRYDAAYIELTPFERKLIWEKYRRRELKYMTRVSRREYIYRNIKAIISRIINKLR